MAVHSCCNISDNSSNHASQTFHNIRCNQFNNNCACVFISDYVLAAVYPVRFYSLLINCLNAVTVYYICYITDITDKQWMVVDQWYIQYMYFIYRYPIGGLFNLYFYIYISDLKSSEPTLKLWLWLCWRLGAQTWLLVHGLCYLLHCL